MYGKDYEILESEVLLVGDSKVFHFLVDHKDSPASRVKSACGNAKSYHTYEATTREDPEKMMEKGKRPCKQCVRILTEVYDIETCTCELCDRLNLLNEIVYYEKEIPYASGGEKTVHICLNCRTRFNMDL